MRKRKEKKNVALFAKEKPGIEKVIAYLKANFAYVDVFKGRNKDAFPRSAYNKEYDICVSYMSPWIIPGKVLSTTRAFAINFHPGPPAYRGIGCTNFAVYNAEKRYGVTAHLMLPKVDSGRIVNVRRFPVSSKDTLCSLTQKCYRHILFQFHRVFDYYLKNQQLPRTDEKWSDKLYTRKALDALCRIEFDMPPDEITRRVKATDFPNMPKAHIDLYGYKFEFKEKAKNE